MKQENFLVPIKDIGEELMNQLDTIASVYDDSEIRIMPDCHLGKGCAIGTVIKLTDKVVPNTVGNDIGCGVLAVNLGKITINDYYKVYEILHQMVPGKQFTTKEEMKVYFNPIFYKRAERMMACLKNHLNAPVYSDDYFYNLGTLGNGNHFIELSYDLNDNLYVLIHTGSRSLGNKICKYYQEKAANSFKDKQLKERKIAIAKIVEDNINTTEKINEEIQKYKDEHPILCDEYAYIEGQDFKDYMEDMFWCCLYAKLNRYIIASNIAKNIFHTPFPSISSSIDCVHNYVDNKLILRKGAIRANEGEKVLIPINMAEGVLIAIGKGNEDWLCSAPHGAGRLLSRTEARRVLSMSNFKELMKDVHSFTVNEDTIDEAPEAYKSRYYLFDHIDPILRKQSVLKPIFNYKIH